MTATVIYEHPNLDVSADEVADYRTLPNGVLACRLPDGGQLLLPPNGWILRDTDSDRQ